MNFWLLNKMHVQKIGKNKTLFQLKESQAGVPSHSGFLFYSGLQLIGLGLPILRREMHFTQSTDSNVNLIQKHPHQYTLSSV